MTISPAALSQQGTATADLRPALASFNKAAGDELRLQILRVLQCDSYTVMELVEIFAIGQSGISHHLKVLAQAGLVARRREGNNIFYSRAHCAAVEPFNQLQLSLLQLTDLLPLPGAIQRRTQAIRARRARHSEQFFEQNADHFHRHQEQICPFDVYAEPVLALMAGLAAEQKHSMLEVGPGSGQLLPELSQMFDQVVALDNSQEMLEAAQANCLAAHARNVEFVLGDTEVLLKRGISVQNAVLTMVLHHVPSPAKLISDVGRLLTPGGQVFIAELCDHDQDWVTQSCGDLWLGIQPGSMSNWAEDSGLSEVGNGQYLGLRNGFTVQIRQFNKPPNPK